MRKRKGFTLIEVMVAMAIFLIVVLAFLGTYYGYYNSLKQLGYRAVGQNLAQVQLEDVRNLSVSVLGILVDGGQWPTTLTYTAPNYPVDTNSSPSIYDSGKIDGAYRIEHINSVLGTSDSSTLPSLLLPSSIIVSPVQEVGPLGSTYYDYTIVLQKETFPRYQREIVITDETPTITQPNDKLYEIKVTVFWTVSGVTKSVTVSSEKSIESSS
jgi:prepilin-type N-terminal cleavage/methylation domain-containing protein